MATFDRLLERVALGILLIGGLGMLMAMFLGAADVVGTQFLGTPVPGALELTESTMVLIVFGALTYAQRRRKHIRVEIFYLRMGQRGRAAMDVLADVAAMLFFGLLGWQAVNEAIFSWQIKEATVGLIRMPLYPARTILVAGVGLLLIQLLIDLGVDVRRVMGLAARGEEPGDPLVSDLGEWAAQADDLPATDSAGETEPERS